MFQLVCHSVFGFQNKRRCTSFCTIWIFDFESWNMFEFVCSFEYGIINKCAWIVNKHLQNIIVLGIRAKTLHTISIFVPGRKSSCFQPKNWFGMILIYFHVWITYGRKKNPNESYIHHTPTPATILWNDSGFDLSYKNLTWITKTRQIFTSNSTDETSNVETMVSTYKPHIQGSTTCTTYIEISFVACCKSNPLRFPPHRKCGCFDDRRRCMPMYSECVCFSKESVCLCFDCSHGPRGALVSKLLDEHFLENYQQKKNNFSAEIDVSIAIHGLR